VRVLRPPIELEVITAEPEPDYEPWVVGAVEASPPEPDPEELATRPPAEVKSLEDEGSDKRPRIQGKVKVASGPWGLEEEWWTESPTGRDYWDVEVAGSGIYRLFRDRATGSWFADGIYD
jgi:hypothetical protein